MSLAMSNTYGKYETIIDKERCILSNLTLRGERALIRDIIKLTSLSYIKGKEATEIELKQNKPSELVLNDYDRNDILQIKYTYTGLDQLMKI